MKFRKNPVEIEAYQWVGFNDKFLSEWTGGRFRVVSVQEQAESFKQDIEAGKEPFDYTAEIYDEIHDTWVKMKLTDWVIKGVQGEFYPCDNGVLKATYTALQDFYGPQLTEFDAPVEFRNKND